MISITNILLLRPPFTLGADGIEAPFDVARQWSYTTGLAAGSAYQPGAAISNVFSSGGQAAVVKE